MSALELRQETGAHIVSLSGVRWKISGQIAAGARRSNFYLQTGDTPLPFVRADRAVHGAGDWKAPGRNGAAPSATLCRGCRYSQVGRSDMPWASPGSTAWPIATLPA